MLLRQTLLYLPAQILGPVAQFVSIVLWTHWLLPRDLGHLALITATQELGFAICLGWFSLFTVRYGARLTDQDWRRRYLDSEMRLLLVATIATVPATMLLIRHLEGSWPEPWLAAAVLAYAITRTTTLHLQDRARASLQTVAYTILAAVGPTLGLLVAWLAVTSIEVSLRAILAGYAIGHIIGLALAVPMMGIGSILGRCDRQVMRQALDYGLPFIVGVPAIWLCANAIRYLVDWAEGAVAVGMITVGWGLGHRVAGFVSMLVAAAAFPLAVKRTHEEGIEAGTAQLRRNGVLLLAVLAPSTVGVILLGRPIVELLVAPAYHQVTIAVLPWAMLAGSLRAMRLHFSNQIFLLHEQPDRAMHVDLIDAVVATAACATGLWTGGLVGAATGAMVGAGLGLLASLTYARFVYGFRVDAQGTLHVIAASALMGLAVWPWTLVGLPASLSLIGGVSSGIVAFAVVLPVLSPMLRAELSQLIARFTADRVAGP